MDFLYIVQCGDDRGPIKIGKATDVEHRLAMLQTGCPFQLTLLVAIRISDGARETEAMLHRRFEAQRLRGEWFKWSPELDEVVHRLEAMNARIIEGLIDGTIQPIA